MAVQFKDYYEILEVPRSAPPEEIKSAYRRLVRKYHPDLNKDTANADARFREVQEAYEVLGDPSKRGEYDSIGAGYQSGMDFQMPNGWADRPESRARSEAESGAAGGFSEFFEALFGSRRPTNGNGPRHQPANGKNAYTAPPSGVRTLLPVTIEEIYEGARKKVTVHINGVCPACQGSGAIGGNRCSACDGRGIAPRARAIELKIPQTIRDGQSLRLPGQGEAGLGQDGAGDLIVQISIQPHPVFTLHDRDIHVELPVAPWEAVLGGEVDVPTLDGPVKMKLPPCTQSGKKMRLRGRGMKTETGRGDEIVSVKIVVPTDITDRERHLFRQLRDVSRFRPRVKPHSSH